jgi:hypothetical protein
MHLARSSSLTLRIQIPPTKPNVDEICTCCCSNKAIIPGIYLKQPDGIRKNRGDARKRIHPCFVLAIKILNPPSGHQFENQTIPHFNRSENDFINGFLFDDFPSGNHPFPVQFSDHGRIARITHGGINVISEKIEKGRQMGIADSFCVWLIAVGKAVQKGKDLIGGNLINLTITKILAESINDGLIRSYRIFFSSGFCDNRSRLQRLWTFSWLTSFV